MDILKNWLTYLRYAILLSTVATVQIFIEPRWYAELGSVAWTLLTIIVLLRPLADIFPDVKLLRKLLPARKELGIAAAMFGIAHGLGFFFAMQLPVSGLFTSGYYWTLDNGYGWGVWAIAVSLPLLLTSNVWAVKLLKKKWKPLQRLTYLFFIAVAVHVSLIKPHELSGMVTIVTIWATLWTMAHFRLNFRDNKKAVIAILFFLVGAKAGLIGYEMANRPPMPDRDGEKHDRAEEND